MQMQISQIPKQKLILIAGIVLGLVAVIMTKFYIDQQKKVEAEKARETFAKMQANQVAVLVAKKDIPKGVAIEPDMFDTAVVPAKYLQPQAVTSLDRISDMVTTSPIAKGEQISLSKLAYPKNAGSGGGLAANTPFGKRAITIAVDNISSLGGMINPGDYVDVIALLPIPVQAPDGTQAIQAATLPLFQNVLVLAVGQNTGAPTRAASGGRYGKEEKQEVSPLITLALSPQEANFITFVQEQGKIRLVLRSPADSKVEPVQVANWQTLFQYLRPETADESEAEPQQAVSSPEGFVEIYRGMNQEKIPISSR